MRKKHFHEPKVILLSLCLAFAITSQIHHQFLQALKSSPR